MVQKYMCQRCGYTTYHKTVFKKHLLKKYICEPNLKDIKKYDLLILNEFFDDAKEHLDKLKNIQKNNKNIHNYTTNINKNEQKNICKFCYKKLSCYSSCKRHEKKCKKNVDKNEIDELKKIIEEKDKKFEESLNEIKIIKDSFFEMKKYINELEKIIKETKSINNNVVNNVNKGTINNFYVNNFGDENINYITQKVVRKLLSKPGTALENLIIKIHFNKNHKENFNMKITNLNNPYGYICKNNKWCVIKKKELIEKVFEDKVSILDIYIDKDDPLYKKKEIFEKKATIDNKELMDTVLNTIINNSKIVIENESNDLIV